MISIHVLREEDDIGNPAKTDTSMLFQSTSSVRRTTTENRIKVVIGIISIHVLREEDDSAGWTATICFI